MVLKSKKQTPQTERRMFWLGVAALMVMVAVGAATLL